MLNSKYIAKLCDLWSAYIERAIIIGGGGGGGGAAAAAAAAAAALINTNGSTTMGLVGDKYYFFL